MTFARTSQNICGGQDKRNALCVQCGQIETSRHWLQTKQSYHKHSSKAVYQEMPMITPKISCMAEERYTSSIKLTLHTNIQKDCFSLNLM